MYMTTDILSYMTTDIFVIHDMTTDIFVIHDNWHKWPLVLSLMIFASRLTSSQFQILNEATENMQLQGVLHMFKYTKWNTTWFWGFLWKLAPRDCPEDCPVLVIAAEIVLAFRMDFPVALPLTSQFEECPHTTMLYRTCRSCYMYI